MGFLTQDGQEDKMHGVTYKHYVFVWLKDIIGFPDKVPVLNLLWAVVRMPYDEGCSTCGVTVLAVEPPRAPITDAPVRILTVLTPNNEHKAVSSWESRAFTPGGGGNKILFRRELEGGG
eukprot:g47452.t1